MPERAAYSYVDTNGERVVCADRAVIKGDPVAREKAFRLFVAQAAAAMGVTAPQLV
jgi:hypothetical protein